TGEVIAEPTMIRTGTGSIDIAAAGDFALLDQTAPGVIYTAGAPVQPAVGGDTSSLTLGGGAVKNSTYTNLTGVSTVLTPEVNPDNAGDVTITVQGDIIGFQKVLDPATPSSAPSALSSKPGAIDAQYWVPWLLTNPANPSVPWYVNFGSFDQGVMSVGG